MTYDCELVTNKNSSNSRRAFTLIEMMMVISMFSVIMGIVYAALRTNDVYNGLIQIQVDLYRQNQRALSSISEELKKSNLATRVTIQDGAGVNNTDIIYFQLPIGLDNNYNIIWGADGTNNYYARYRLDATAAFLLRDILAAGLTPAAGTGQQKAYRIIDLQFADSALDASVPSGSIRITSTAQRQSPDKHNITLSNSALVYLEN
ncbi:MAG: type II secretion system GspH family protein [Candidatus Omnitrophica bacterium]|nr:type II secretion system GspH family protein [Candidatus Omnitrophota bacterium]MBU4479249.1 type II secretion system GspH family protein [Candidatus Omnitrophota bacterium]